MLKGIGAPEIIIILVVLVLLFGAKRLPDAARSLGRSMRIFKSEVKEMGNDGDEKPRSRRPVPRLARSRAGSSSRPPPSARPRRRSTPTATAEPRAHGPDSPW